MFSTKRVSGSVGGSGPGFLLAVLIAPAFSCAPDDPGPRRSASSPSAAEPYSNLLSEDYVGPETCRKCHPQNHARWNEHPHSRMNALADEGAVLGDFSGARLPYAEGEAVFRKQDGRFLVEYFRKGRKSRAFKVTRTIGWRYLQEYVGVQIEGPEPADDVLYREETRLKFGYVLKDKRWLPQCYLDAPDNEPEYREDGRPRYDPFDPERTPFNQRCIHCHNTYPYELRLYSSERLLGFPPAPAAGIEALLRTRPAYREQQSNSVLPPRSLVTVGISCESCHFGGREHSKDPRKAMRFVPTHPALAKWAPDFRNAGKNPAVVNSICRQCHFSGGASWADGAALLNSMESIEQDRGACATQLSCTACHNPHLVGPRAGAPDRPERVAACTQCHDPLRPPEAARAHARHDPAAVSCLDCHMPRIVHGFDAMNRTHRISSPSDPKILASGMANACNLCHLDRSLAWTRDEIEKGWGRRVELPRSLEEVFGTRHEKPAGEAWLAQPFGTLQVVAGAAYARSSSAKKALPKLLRALDEPNAYLRTRALQNVELALGARLDEREFNLTGPPEVRREQIERLILRHSK